MDRRALWLWFAFFGTAVVLNGTLPFAAGADLHEWTDSKTKGVLFGVLVYGGLFTGGSLVLAKGWAAVRRPGVLVPLSIAMASLGVHGVFRPAAIVSLLALVYLHLRHDLSDLAVRSSLDRRSVAAVLMLGLLPLVARGLSAPPAGIQPGEALRAGLDRLLFNPASTTENLFYFGLLAERLEAWSGRWGTPLLVGAMYTAHEMTNPEYWYEGMSFPLVFAGVVITTVVYQWCRNTVAIWLSSGLARFVTHLW